MADPARRFEIVNDEPEAANSAPDRATQILLLSLQTLSKRAVIALESCFTLITSGLVFWLWLSMPMPTTHQLVGLGMFAAFILAANWMFLRRTK